MITAYRYPQNGPVRDTMTTHLDHLQQTVATLTGVVEKLTGEMIALRLELAAARERWENGAETP